MVSQSIWQLSALEVASNRSNNTQVESNSHTVCLNVVFTYLIPISPVQLSSARKYISLSFERSHLHDHIQQFLNMNFASTNNTKVIAGLAVAQSHTYRIFEELQDSVKETIALHRLMSSFDRVGWLLYQFATRALMGQATPHASVALPFATRMMQVEEQMFEAMEHIKDMRELSKC